MVVVTVEHEDFGFRVQALRTEIGAAEYLADTAIEGEAVGDRHRFKLARKRPTPGLIVEQAGQPRGALQIDDVR